MTELETMRRAKMYMDKLAGGIDPITDTALPQDTALNNDRLSRCFAYVSGVLDRVIANGGEVGATVKSVEFSITAEQLSRIDVSEEPLRITQFTELINNEVKQPQMKKLATTVITNWLLIKGYLEKRQMKDGKSHRVPSQKGMAIGLSTHTWQGTYGEYLAVLYSADAQRFVLDHLQQMIAER